MARYSIVNDDFAKSRKIEILVEGASIPAPGYPVDCVLQWETTYEEALEFCQKTADEAERNISLRA